MLEQSPFDVDPSKLKDIKVWGTVLEGRVQPANIATAGDTGDQKKAGLDPMPSAAIPLPPTLPASALLAITSGDYLLAASRSANDRGLCNDHAKLVKALSGGLEQTLAHP